MLEKTLPVLDDLFIAHNEKLSNEVISLISEMERSTGVHAESTLPTLDDTVQRLLKLSERISDDEISVSLVMTETRCLADESGVVAAEKIVGLLRPICGLADAQLTRMMSRYVSTTSANDITLQSLALLLLEMKKRTTFSNPKMLTSLFRECICLRESLRTSMIQRLTVLHQQNEGLLRTQRMIYDEKMSQLTEAEEKAKKLRRDELRHFFSRKVRLQSSGRDELLCATPAGPVDTDFIVEQILVPNRSR
jgi:hypothetical protein